MKTLMLIVNPASGKGQAKKILGSVLSIFRNKGYASTVYLTTERGQATGFAREYGGKYELLVCVGGDGTLSEVIEGLMQIERSSRPAVGYIPMGTANDIATSLSLPKIPESAAEVAVTGQVIDLDIGRIGDHIFSYIAAFGAFTDVPYTTPQNNKNILGHLAYLIEGVGKIATIKPHWVMVEHDDGVIEDEFLFGCVMNTMSVGGIVKLGPEIVGLSDGYFEILLVKKPKNVLDYNGIIASVTSQKFDNENIILLHTKNARFRFDYPVSWTRDGEDGGALSDIVVENLHCAIKMVVPEGGD